MIFLATALILLGTLVISWFAVFLIFKTSFYSTVREFEDPNERLAREEEERAALVEDLSRPAIGQRELTQLGVAENSTAANNDAENELPGDSWLCDGRPLCFAVIQLLLSYPLTLVAVSIPWPRWPIQTTVIVSSFFSLTVVTIWLGLKCYVNVPENTRLGLKFFGKQRRGYLAPGLQFVLFPFSDCSKDESSQPWLRFEKVEIVPLQNLVWGPSSGDVTEEIEDQNSDDELNFGGSLGTPSNPSEGKFQVALHGRWLVDVEVMITLRVRRGHKDSWWRWLNDYASITEIGERIASTASAILTTKAREMQAIGDVDDDPEVAASMLLEFLNNIPEISGEILQTLQNLGHGEHLGGILPISVAFASVIPGVEFRTVLQDLDRTRVAKLQQQLRGEGTVLRLDRMREFVRSMNNNADDPAGVIALERLLTQREFAQSESGAGAVINAFAAQTTKKATE